jgi:hypothetical protein
VSGFRLRPGKEVLNRAVLTPEEATIKKSAQSAVAFLLADIARREKMQPQPFPKPALPWRTDPPRPHHRLQEGAGKAPLQARTTHYTSDHTLQASPRGPTGPFSGRPEVPLSFETQEVSLRVALGLRVAPLAFGQYSTGTLRGGHGYGVSIYPSPHNPGQILA